MALTERQQRQVDRLLDDAERASEDRDWVLLRERAEMVLGIDPDNADGRTFLSVAERGASLSELPPPAPARTTSIEQPSSFVAGRYAVRRFLGEGGKKRVYLAHDERLDRDVAFALIKTEGLDDVGRERPQRRREPCRWPPADIGRSGVQRERSAQPKPPLGGHSASAVSVLDLSPVLRTNVAIRTARGRSRRTRP